MSEELSGRSAVVTGSGRGLGAAMALGLMRAGANVLVTDIDDEAVKCTVAEADAAGLGTRAVGLTADISAAQGISAIISETIHRFGRLDILVNNAAIGQDAVRRDYLRNPGGFDEVSDEAVRYFFAVNAIAPIALATKAVKDMRRRSWGRIVNVTTSLDTMLRKGMLPYGGTKASLEAHTAIMAQDLAETGITANVLVPGGVADTRMVPEEIFTDRSRLVDPHDLVAPLIWLLEDRHFPPNGIRVMANRWNNSPDTSDTSIFDPVGWPVDRSVAVIPKV